MKQDKDIIEACDYIYSMAGADELAYVISHKDPDQMCRAFNVINYYPISKSIDIYRHLSPKAKEILFEYINNNENNPYWNKNYYKRFLMEVGYCKRIFNQYQLYQFDQTDGNLLYYIINKIDYNDCYISTYMFINNKYIEDKHSHKTIPNEKGVLDFLNNYKAFEY